MAVELLNGAFDPWAYLTEYQRKRAHRPGRFGATAVFVGTMRDFNEDESVQSMLLEHYPAMTLKYLEEISVEAVRHWKLIDSLIVHRVGELLPGEPIVLVAVWSAHRKAAFEASRYLMEELKCKVPLWKKEQLQKGGRWVQANTPA